MPPAPATEASMTGDTELPPLDADPDEWDEMWNEKTTITVDRWVKAHLDHDRDGQPWNQYLETLRRQKADPVTLSDAQVIAEYLEDKLSLTVDDDLTLSYPTSDVKEAMRAVLREELPEGALR